MNRLKSSKESADQWNNISGFVNHLYLPHYYVVFEGLWLSVWCHMTETRKGQGFLTNWTKEMTLVIQLKQGNYFMYKYGSKFFLTMWPDQEKLWHLNISMLSAQVLSARVVFLLFTVTDSLLKPFRLSIREISSNWLCWLCSMLAMPTQWSVPLCSAWWVIECHETV